MAHNFVNQERKIDVIFCIDGTGSMVSLWESLRRDLKRFLSAFRTALIDNYGWIIGELNVKIIVFRDYRADCEKAIEYSEWFEISDENQMNKLQQFVDGVEVDGGGDEPENGLEALFYAMTTDWKACGDRDRQIIILLTDADALPLGYGKGYPAYPHNMVDYDGLCDTWMGRAPDFVLPEQFRLKERCKLLVMCAPQGTVYQELQSRFNRMVFVEAEEGGRLSDFSIDYLSRIVYAI